MEPNPGAVSRDGTKKYQAKLGLVKDEDEDEDEVYQMFLNICLLSFPIKYENIKYYNKNTRSFFIHYSYKKLHLAFICTYKQYTYTPCSFFVK